MAKEKKSEDVAVGASAEVPVLKTFSELPAKAEIVVKNTNGVEQIVTKAAWMSIVTNDLDRLQGIELLGVAVRNADGGFEIEEIEDDFEVQD